CNVGEPDFINNVERNLTRPKRRDMRFIVSTAKLVININITKYSRAFLLNFFRLEPRNRAENCDLSVILTG
ncbi:MAG: hypothetical protein K2G75_03955, partial [Muribaculaceae bacterium]|nr:hypothetical protein [Muribaculaceae bacterium]